MASAYCHHDSGDNALSEQSVIHRNSRILSSTRTSPQTSTFSGRLLFLVSSKSEGDLVEMHSDKEGSGGGALHSVVQNFFWKEERTWLKWFGVLEVKRLCCDEGGSNCWVQNTYIDILGLRDWVLVQCTCTAVLSTPRSH